MRSRMATVSRSVAQRSWRTSWSATRRDLEVSSRSEPARPAVARPRTRHGAQLRDLVEEGQHTFCEQRCGVFVVRRQAGVGEQVLLAGIEEQFGVRGRRDQSAGCVEVAFVDEELVGIHPVNLDRDSRWPCTAELGGRYAGVEQLGTLRSGS